MLNLNKLSRIEIEFENNFVLIIVDLQ